MSESMRYAKYIQAEKTTKSAVTRRVAMRRGGRSQVGVVDMQFSVPVSVRLDKGLYDSIRRYAKSNSIGVGAAIRMLLVHGLKKKDDEATPCAAN